MPQTYLNKITETYLRGDAREESYYETLSVFLKQFGESRKFRLDITTLPKKTEAGNPDFRVWDGKQHITGYIEAKDPMVRDLDKIERSEQLGRYRSTFPNVILTNFLEFRLYRDGELTDKVTIGEPQLLKKIGTAPLKNQEAFEALLDKFLSYNTPVVRTAKQLAEELAKRTKFLRDEVLALELNEETREGKAIIGFYEGFKKYLVGTLTMEQFADLYAQTITYGLFAARTRSGNDAEFTRRSAFDYIPNTIGILRDVFEFISLGKAPRQLEILVDDIAEVLQVTDVNNILQRFYEEGKGQDPIIHFYETFLAKYDPSVRERRGVYYTPEPVVHYITKSLHHLLRTKFGKPDGFASEGVTVLDPAGGTLTFPAEAIKLAVDEYTTKYGTGGRKSFIQNHILKNFYAFELMMAPYAIGHLKIGFLLEELGYHMGEDERFPLYLTNTLEMEELDQISIPGLGSLSEESHLAGKVKKSQPILVVMGNPPYSANSANYNEWTDKLLKEDLDGLQSYYKVDDAPLGEANSKLLQDDYVKFLRFAEWKIQKAGHGVVGMITNHSYLDNPTFRGMRQSLTKTFDEIYIINLHGNALKKETAQDGSKDENVFDIRQGTAIIVLVKSLEPKKKGLVKSIDLWGLRENKYEWLDANDLKSSKFEEIKPESPWYFLIPRNTKTIEHFTKWPSITEIFPVNSTGIKTHRDHFIIAFEKRELETRILHLRNKQMDDELIRETYDLKDSEVWKLAESRSFIQKEGDLSNYYQPIAYRPFDTRHTFFSNQFMDRARMEVMDHMLKENIGLVVSRQTSLDFKHAFITNSLCDVNYTGTAGKYGAGNLFPLYLYKPKEDKKKSKAGQMLMFALEPEEEYLAKRPNISKEIFRMLEMAYGRKPSPENIFYYIYAVLYSPTYRSKYAEFLKIDFPRVPFAKSHKVFLDLAVLGERLAGLHLLQSTELDTPIARYMGEGDDDVIVKPEFVGEGVKPTPNLPTDRDRPSEEGNLGVVKINATKYFEGVPEEVWNYHIGGYQVLHKYLKDRKGRKMEDPRHYCRIVTALAKTIELQKEIDVLFAEVEKEVIEMNGEQ